MCAECCSRGLPQVTGTARGVLLRMNVYCMPRFFLVQLLKIVYREKVGWRERERNKLSRTMEWERGEPDLGKTMCIIWFYLPFSMCWKCKAIVNQPAVKVSCHFTWFLWSFWACSPFFIFWLNTFSLVPSYPSPSFVISSSG